MRLKKGGDGEGNDNPLLYPCLGNPMDKGAWETTVRGGGKKLDMTERHTCTHIKIHIYILKLYCV